ncbi:phage head morphogenesis protein [Rhodobacter capsulatus]|uniref:phage head morphogenesis protein n=1 Tax=Rhodobacter capsulatus TaxID=1061 RepID=UPI0003D3881A|nr:phage minor head protein [Rhodobacter capsulatus]ETD85741.1 phage head protein [Rhodobacter capsulatus YW1]
MADLGASFGKPFDLQLAALRLRLANQVGTAAWDDLVKAQHDRAFVVAGAMKADLLADLAKAVEKSIAQGTTLEEFRRDFRALVERHGWHGWTGEGSARGEAWRTKVIYRTNMATSYAAGRWAQLLESGVPYIIYMRGNALEHRQEHLPWHGLVLPVGHPFWRTHATPNGWGCTCYLSGARSLDAARRRGGDPNKALPAGWDAIDPRTGAPVGIDKGWDYAPGASVAQELAGIVEKKAATLPPQIAKDFKDSMKSIVQAGVDPADQSPKTPAEAIARGKAVMARLRAQATDLAAAEQAGDLTGAAMALQDAVRAELRKVRPVGEAPIALVPGSRKQAKEVMQSVADVMPSDWVRAANAIPLKVYVSETKRGGYLPGNPPQITTSESSTAVHEYLHHLQAVCPDLDLLFQDLHRKRTKGEPLVQIRRGEWARKDHYYNAYQGREYAFAKPNPALEMLTMALQPVLGSDIKSVRMLRDLMKVDPEMLEMALGVLFYWKV